MPDPRKCRLNVAQVLALSDTAVIAAARPTDDFQGLLKLQDQFAHRLTIVKLELLQPSTIQARLTALQATLAQCVSVRCTAVLRNDGNAHVASRA